jgi:hypothetical protein
VARDAGGRGGANDESDMFRLSHYNIDTDPKTVQKQFFDGARGVKMTEHEWTKVGSATSKRENEKCERVKSSSACARTSHKSS